MNLTGRQIAMYHLEVMYSHKSDLCDDDLCLQILNLLLI